MSSPRKAAATATATAALDGFADGGAVSSWAVPAMEWAVSAGVLKGSGGTLVPGGQASRAEVAAMLMRLCQVRKG